MKTLFRLLLAVALCSIASAQNINVQADATTGLLWRPSTLFSNSTNGAAIYSGAGFPAQTGNSGKFLTTNGSALSWAVVSGSGTVTSVDVATANGVSATGGPITSSGSFTFTLGAITPSSVASTGAISGTTGTFSTLTSGRVPIVSTAGLLADDADLTFSGDTLTATKGNFGLMTFISNVITSSSTNTLELLGGVGGARIRLPNNSTTADFNGNIALANTITLTDTFISRIDVGTLRTTAPVDTAGYEILAVDTSGAKSYFQSTINGIYSFSWGVRQGTTAFVINSGSALGGTDIVTLTTSGISTPKVTSTVATGTAPFVVSSTTKVDNLHVARATLADTVTTNANLTGDVTSVGNATTLAAGSASNLNSGTLPAARMPALTGDITTSSGAVATTLATVNSNVGTFGSATAASVVTVNAKGLVTAASNTTVTPAVGSITGLGTNVGTFLATPSSANLAAAITDEVGTGPAQFSNIVFNAQTGTAYESVASDAGKWITMSNASANVLTIPDNATVSYASGVSIIVEMRGAGATSVSPKNGNVTIQSRDSALKLYGQYSVGVLTLHTVSGDATTWNFSGDIKP